VASGILNMLPTGHVTRRMRSELLAFNMGKCKFEALYLPNGSRSTDGYNGPPIGNYICRVEWSRDPKKSKSWPHYLWGAISL